VLLPRARHRSLFDLEVAAAYLAGTSAGALLTAAVAWVLSGFAEPLGAGPRAALLVTGAVFVALCKVGPLSGVIALPEARRQIPAEVFGGSLVRGAFRFGLELGTGMRTYIPSIAPYVLVLTLLLARPTLGDALVIGLGFGLGRAIPVIAAIAAIGTAGRLRTLVDGLRQLNPVAAVAAGCVVLVGGLGLV
jgi:hypothetical protein